MTIARLRAMITGATVARSGSSAIRPPGGHRKAWRARRRRALFGDGTHALRAPLTHFVLLGIALFTAYVASERQDASIDPQAERDALYRAAVALGIDQQAAIVRTRLVDIGDFLELHDGGDARALGLAQTDPVIRRHVEQLGELALRSGGSSVLPSAAEVEDYYAAYPDQFVADERVRLTQVYFSLDRRGGAAESHAHAALARLRAGGAPAGEGDPFVHGSLEKSATSRELERAFGREIALSVDALTVGQWSQPLRSPYGLHLVWVYERSPAGRVPLTAVRNQIVHRLAQERSALLAARRLDLVRRTVARQTP